MNDLEPQTAKATWSSGGGHVLGLSAKAGQQCPPSIRQSRRHYGVDIRPTTYICPTDPSQIDDYSKNLYPPALLLGIDAQHGMVTDHRDSFT